MTLKNKENILVLVGIVAILLIVFGSATANDSEKRYIEVKKEIVVNGKEWDRLEFNQTILSNLNNELRAELSQLDKELFQ